MIISKLALVMLSEMAAAAVGLDGRHLRHLELEPLQQVSAGACAQIEVVGFSQNEGDVPRQSLNGVYSPIDGMGNCLYKSGDIFICHGSYCDPGVCGVEWNFVFDGHNQGYCRSSSHDVTAENLITCNTWKERNGKGSNIPFVETPAELSLLGFLPNPCKFDEDMKDYLVSKGLELWQYFYIVAFTNQAPILICGKRSGIFPSYFPVSPPQGSNDDCVPVEAYNTYCGTPQNEFLMGPAFNQRSVSYAQNDYLCCSGETCPQSNLPVWLGNPQ